MNSTQFTPRPWKAEKTQAGQIAVFTTALSYNVLDASAPGVNAKANAQLIAAAPDLLESCQELLKMVDELLPLAPKGCGWGTLATDQARAAIAKAIGQ